ncbi:hypothetical protein [Edaphobacter aggregans]|uniref:hypothetical protein n=1 Tax=Edaphobacter aggregans TaxID=570835 RepID=UPI00055874E2|nr:hypothetical protein [Edaphobacter aggregans]
MKRLTGLLAGLSVMVTGLGVAAAQEAMGPPKVLVIQSELVKPGRGGALHERSESAFVRAMVAAKWPTHYVALESLSGPTRALFLTGYPSFAAWEKDNQDMAKNATLSAAIDKAMMSDGDLLTSYDQGAFIYNEEGSLRAGTADVPRSRYFEISVFHVRPGHRMEWEELVKLYREGYEKIPNAKWALFESVYGADNGGMYLVFNPMKSLAEVEQGYADQKKFVDAMGEGKMKKLGELTASCIESEQTNLFRFNPKMSYPLDSWVKEDPTFWKPKMTAPAKAEKPVQ